MSAANSQRKKKAEGASRKSQRIKLAEFVMRMAPKIIGYARRMSHTLKKRYSHQLLMFPNSKQAIFGEQAVPDDLNLALIDEYKSNGEYDYPFYLSACGMFIDNRHLTLFQNEKPIKYDDLKRLNLGEFSCFGEYISSSRNGVIIKPESEKMLILGTLSGEIATINSEAHQFRRYQIARNQSIKAILIYNHYLLAFTDHHCYANKLVKQVVANIKGKSENSQPQFHAQQMLSILPLFSSKITKNSPIQRPAFYHIQQSFYVFFIDEFCLHRVQLKESFISYINSSQVICTADKFNPFTNLKIHAQEDLNRVLITVSCTKEILIYSHHCEAGKSSLLYKMANPKNPAPIPKSHTYNCIEYFPISSNSEYFTLATVQNPATKKSEKSSYLLVALSFTERIYFVRVWEDHCEISKRVKFFNRIIKIIPYKQDGIFIVFHKEEESEEDKPASEVITLQITATLLSQIASFGANIIHTETIFKLDFETSIVKKQDSRGKFKASFFLHDGREILIMTDEGISRTKVKTWKNVFEAMLQTENIQLLYFLILLKNYKSPFFLPPTPEEFKGLEKFFESNLDISHAKQIFLEYFYETNQEPPIMFYADVSPQLLLPFILEHKISNLSENSKQLLVQYWRNKDERVVEQIIVGGVEYGWEMAVSKGWMRALHKMVEMGMEIHFPLLKLSSFIVSQMEILNQMQAKWEQEGVDYNEEIEKQQIAKIENYCEQIINYSLLALDNFLVPEQIDNLEELQDFVLTLLREQILTEIIEYRPLKAVKLISKLFKAEQSTTIIDKLDIKQFLHLQKDFKYLIRQDFLNVSETVLSYFSETYLLITQSKNKAKLGDLRSKYKQELILEHAKLIRNSMQQGMHSKCKFQFSRGYMIEMLLTLIGSNNENIHRMLAQERVLMEKEELDCYIQDFLARIWEDIKSSPFLENEVQSRIQDSIDKQPDSNGELTISEIKELISCVEQANSSNNYLLIVMMKDIPPIGKDNNCSKILRKYIYSGNRLIQQRTFEWLVNSMRKPQNYQLLSKEVMMHLRSLIQINKQRSRDLFDQFYQNKEKEIIRKIDNDPLLQLEYVEMIIEESVSHPQSIEEYYLNLHLKLLITEQPQRVIAVLEEGLNNKFKYDLQQALRISLDLEYFQKSRVETYLFEKIGDVERCISSYLKTLDELFWSYVQGYEQNAMHDKEKEKVREKGEAQEEQEYEFDQQRKKTSKITLIISELMQTNKQYSQNQGKLLEIEEEISATFKELTDLIFRQPIKKYEYVAQPLNSMVRANIAIRQEKLERKQHYFSMLGFYYGKIVSEIFERGYVESFVQWLQTNQKINLNAIKKYLIEGYKKIISEATLLNNMSIIDENVLVNNIKEMLVIMEKHVYSEAKCYVCERSFTESSSEGLLFNCGHLFHKNCIEEDENGQDYCWECIRQDKISAMIEHSEMNMVSLLHRYCQKKMSSFDVVEQAKKKEPVVSAAKKKLNRLAVFDKKVGTLHNQAEILDMKLQILEYYQKMEHLQH